MVLAYQKVLQALVQAANVEVPGSDVRLSYPTGLTITGVASNASAVMSNHMRQYPSGAVEVNGASVTNLTYGATYWIYYDAPPGTKGNVTYAATPTQLDAFASGDNPNRTFVGVLTMPANAGAANTTGVPANPPGYVTP